MHPSLPAPHAQMVLALPELGTKPVLVLGNKVDRPGALQSVDALRAALGLPPHGGRVGPHGGPLDVRMCSTLRREGYPEGGVVPCVVPYVAAYSRGVLLLAASRGTLWKTLAHEKRVPTRAISHLCLNLPCGPWGEGGGGEQVFGG
jgi:hypothetical protein